MVLMITDPGSKPPVFKFLVSHPTCVTLNLKYFNSLGLNFPNNKMGETRVAISKVAVYTHRMISTEYKMHESRDLGVYCLLYIFQHLEHYLALSRNSIKNY